MWPWGHLAFGYVLYSLVSRVVWRRPPEWPAVVALAFGTQLPDLIDKPLAWTFGLLPSGRSLAHSLVFGTLIVLVVLLLLRRLERFERAAFAVGYFSHLAGDALRPVLSGDLEHTRFLLWPLMSLPPSGETKTGIIQFLLDAELSGTVVVELGFAAVVVVWWILDGAPGLGALLRALGRGESPTTN
jgi:hypothetical protein